MFNERLFSPLRLGAIQLPNRIVMAPLTRMRAGPANVPTALNAEYYAQRSSAGLIISEGTAISFQAQGYPNAPGIYTAAQIAGWRTVTEKVHARGGRIVMQIAHNGRNSHSSLMLDGATPVAPSAIAPTIPALTKNFQQVPAETPRPLEQSEIAIIIGDFRQAALSAVEAGFDGVELQGANSHLIEQFLEDGTNQRTDAYGGSKENRARLLLEIVDQVAAAIGAERLGRTPLSVWPIRRNPRQQPLGVVHPCHPGTQPAPNRLFAFNRGQRLRDRFDRRTSRKCA
jgi:N-ethylmaleimide reductase